MPQVTPRGAVIVGRLLSENRRVATENRNYTGPTESPGGDLDYWNDARLRVGLVGTVAPAAT